MSSCHNEIVTTDDVRRLGRSSGSTPSASRRRSPTARRRRHIRARRARGLFGRLRFTTAKPEVSCHPERLLDGARSVVSAALCYYRPERRDPGRPRPAAAVRAGGTATRRCARRLDTLGHALGAPYRVLVDANQHVDREAAARSGVGFYGKNTMLITRRHGSWVVLGTLVTAARARADAAARRRLRVVHALHRRLPDGRAGRAGDARRDPLPLVLDAGARADPGDVPCGARRPGLRLRHLPGRLPLESRRRAAPGRRAAGRRRARRPRRLAPRRRRRRTCSRGCTCRATSRAGCCETRSSHSATPAARTARPGACCGATPPGRTRCSQSTRPGRSAGWRSDAAERARSAGSRSSGWSSCRSC